MSYQNIREEELKNKIAEDFFLSYDTTKIIGNVDFCVAPKTKKGMVPLFGERPFKKVCLTKLNISVNFNNIF